MAISDLVQLQLGWLNAWIPSFALVLIQFLYMLLYKEGGKRAVDTSWHTAKDKRYATLSYIIQLVVLLISLFVPLQIGTPLFMAGSLLFAFALVGFMAAFHAYASTPKGEIVVRGVYRLSRNPMYFFYEVGALAICIAAASLLLLLATILLILVTHGVILGEEQYCMTTYGEDYAWYKARTPRYFYSNSNLMNNLSKILNSATMGQPRRLRPLIWWTVAEYFFRGAPYGAMLLVVWEIFKPLQHPGTSINLMNIAWAWAVLLISLICLWFIGKKAYLVAYRDGYEICCDGRLVVIDHLRRLPMGFFNSRDPGDIGAYIVSDYNNVEMLTTHLIGQFFGGLAMPIVALVSLSFCNWQLAMAAASVIPLAYPMMLLTNRFVAILGKKHQKIKRNASSRMIEYIQGIRLIRAFNLNGNKFERLEHAFRELKRESIYLEAAPAPTITLASTLLNGGLLLIMLLGFSMLLDAQVSIPVYIMFLLAGSAIYAPLINAMTFIALINYMKLSAERIDALCNTPVLPEGTIEEVTGSEVEFRNVDFSYNEDIPVLRDVSLVIPEKRLTALVGPSGSGKTTLTRLIARFWDVNKGEILLGGRNVRDYTLHTLMQQISIVFQDVYLFNDTIYNNIRVGRETATQEEIEAAARKAQCHEFITAMPDGYDTLVGEGGSTLSGGEKQRISIARAILKDAPIVLLDEATASLDPENEVHIQDAINDLVKEKTVVIIAHRLGTLVNADNIVVINQGRVVQQGKHQTLLEEGGLYRNLWQEQQRVKRWKF